MVGMKDSRLTHPSQSQYPILALIDRFLALIDDRFPALAVPIKISMHEQMYYDDRIAITYDRVACASIAYARVESAPSNQNILTNSSRWNTGCPSSITRSKPVPVDQYTQLYSGSTGHLMMKERISPLISFSRSASFRPIKKKS